MFGSKHVALKELSSINYYMCFCCRHICLACGQLLMPAVIAMLTFSLSLSLYLYWYIIIYIYTIATFPMPLPLPNPMVPLVMVLLYDRSLLLAAVACSNTCIENYIYILCWELHRPGLGGLGFIQILQASVDQRSKSTGNQWRRLRCRHSYKIIK